MFSHSHPPWCCAAITIATLGYDHFVCHHSIRGCIPIFVCALRFTQLRSPTSDEGWQLRHVHGRNRSGEEDTNECTGACRTWRLSEEGSQSSTWIIDDLKTIKARGERRTYPLSTLVKDCCQVCLPRFAAKTWVKDPPSLRHAASQVACTGPTCQHSGNTYSCIEMQTG